MGWGKAPLLIYCRNCGGEQPADKKHGPLPGSKRCAWVWWNVCRNCDRHFAGLPPAVVEPRRKARQLARAGQMELGV